MTVQVREFDSADALMAHYKAMKARARYAPPPSRRPIAKPTRQSVPASVSGVSNPGGRDIYAWPIGPRHTRDILYVATPAIEGGIQTAQDIIRQVAKKHGLTVLGLKDARRNAYLVLARQECFYRLKHETTLSFPHIGRMMGHRDHTTVLHGVKRFTERLARGEVTL